MEEKFLEQNKKNTSLKKIRKIILYFLLGLVLLILTLGVALSLPSVQTAIAQYVTEKLNEDYKTDIHVEEAVISIFGGVKLKDVLVK
ncbi:MAG: hypothetical protein ABI426_06840, partial [Flavobacterium sp.]